MEVAIRHRRVEVPDDLRVLTKEKVSKLARFLEGVDHAEVLFSEEKNPRIGDRERCEITISGHGHVVRAHANAGDAHSALDAALNRAELQLTKLKKRLQTRSHPHHRSAPMPEGRELTPKIVRSKRFEVPTMDPDDAAWRMDLLGHDFFLFNNADTGKSAVIYRRGDGDYGVIEGQ